MPYLFPQTRITPGDRKRLARVCLGGLKEREVKSILDGFRDCRCQSVARVLLGRSDRHSLNERGASILGMVFDWEEFRANRSRISTDMDRCRDEVRERAARLLELLDRGEINEARVAVFAISGDLPPPDGSKARRLLRDRAVARLGDRAADVLPWIENEANFQDPDWSDGF